MSEQIFKWNCGLHDHETVITEALQKALAKGGVLACPYLSSQQVRPFPSPSSPKAEAQGLPKMLVCGCVGECHGHVEVEPVDPVKSAIRALHQDYRPYMRHLDDCKLVAFRSNPSILKEKRPPCTCGLEKVLWGLPDESAMGKEK